MSMKALFLTLLAASVAAAQSEPHPTGPRITPPTVNMVSPLGIARGATTEMSVEGLNLGGASAIYFSEPGITGKIVRVKELPDLAEVRLGSGGLPATIDLGPLPPRNQVVVEVSVPAEAAVGPVSFRLLTPLGTSPPGMFLIEPFYGESSDREPNDSIDRAVETYLPAVLTGAISRTGDVDYYKIQARAGEEIYFDNQAMDAGSTLQPVVRVLADDQSVLREFGYDHTKSARRFSVRFERAGRYYIGITDFEQTGQRTHFYRILAGRFPVVTSVYPLGVRRGAESAVRLDGFHLGANEYTVKGQPSAEDPAVVTLRPKVPAGLAFNEVRLDLGDDPEVESTGANTSRAKAQPVTLPATINGRIGEPVNGVPVEHYYRFAARKGEKLVFEVKARRFGSELDSLVEVVDAKGQPIERAVARAVWETFVVLRDHDSASRGIRIQSWNLLNVGDYIMIGNEICRVDQLPEGPDEDMRTESFGGVRKAFFGTSSEAHANDRPVYKIQIHPPGSQFTPNGLPLARLYYRNDDGGAGYGKDSYLDFAAPADGDYYVRVRDVRGFGGNDYAYRLNIRPPRPDYRLAVNPRNPNVPVGGTIPVTVTAFRMDGFDGPIEVSVADLPTGLRATKGVIAAGQDSTTILLSADHGFRIDGAARFDVNGKAAIGGRETVRSASPEDRVKFVALMPKPDVLMIAETKVVELTPGGQAEIAVRIERNNDYGGRVPVQVLNLPPRVLVADSGLNGVLITEDENHRSFQLRALPNAEPVEQMIYVAGVTETRSPQQSAYAAVQPILVKVKPASERTASAVGSSPAAGRR
jgi:hypothetical protein